MPQTVQWINKCWNIHTMEYYKPMRIAISCDNMDESHKHHIEWKNLDTKECILYISVGSKHKTAQLTYAVKVRRFAWRGRGQAGSIWKGTGLWEEGKGVGVRTPGMLELSRFLHWVSEHWSQGWAQIVTILWAICWGTVYFSNCIFYHNKKVFKEHERTKLSQASISRKEFSISQIPVHHPNGWETWNRRVNYIKNDQDGTWYRVHPYKKTFILIIILTHTLSVLPYPFVHSFPMNCNHVFASFPFPLNDQQLGAHGNILIVSKGLEQSGYLTNIWWD